VERKEGKIQINGKMLENLFLKGKTVSKIPTEE